MKIERLFKQALSESQLSDHHGKQKRKNHRLREQELGEDKDDDYCKERSEDDYFKKSEDRGQRLLQGKDRGQPLLQGEDRRHRQQVLSEHRQESRIKPTTTAKRWTAPRTSGQKSQPRVRLLFTKKWRIIFGMDNIRRVSVNLKKLSSERDKKIFEWWMAFSTTREEMAYARS